MRFLGILALGLLVGCDASVRPENREPAADGGAYQAQYRTAWDENLTTSAGLNAERCAPDNTVSRGHHPIADRDVLSPGDLVRVFVEEDETFSGSYVVGRDGTLRLPFARPVKAIGQSPEWVASRVSELLVDAEFYDVPPRVSVLLADFSAARVSVAGAVFEPGAVTVGGANAATRDPLRQEALGASTFSRSLSSALRAAGGVRPDADLARAVIHRGHSHILADLRPAIEGRDFPDLLLVNGDRIEIPSRKCFQEALMVPSPITPPGTKVFMSNLSVPANANALSAIGKEARELRYGTRFIQAVVGMNCFGGSKLVNASRRAVLFSRNPVTGESVVIERRIEDLLRRADRDEFDPFILPNDAIACYDSNLVDLVDLAKALGVIGALAFIDENN